MYFNLSLRNVKRSFKDYSIYFLTLTFAVCIFYAFNSLDSQTVMLSLSERQSGLIELLNEVMSIISIFIATVLGFLIVYANNFLIKRRKKELGIYSTLGMSKRRISFILLTETIIIGLISLIIGLLIGVWLSQGLSFLTAKLFEVDIKHYTFVFSTAAFTKTLFYFGIIFLLVMIFNTLVISKYKLINLLNAHKKGENLNVKNLYLSIILFIISIACLAEAYYLVLKNVFLESNILIPIILGCIGTLLFFMSLSGFIIKLVQMNKKTYFKNLNMFVLRQINSKITTTFVSMTVICLMLFLTITALSTSFSFKKTYENNLKENSPYDASLTLSDFLYYKSVDPIDLLESYGMNINDYSNKYDVITKYKTNISIYYIIKDYIQDNMTKEFFNATNEQLLPTTSNHSASIINITDLNNALKLQDKSQYKLDDNEVLFLSNFNSLISLKEPLNEYLKNNNSININGKDYKIKSKEVLTDTLETSYMNQDLLIFVLPDKDIENLSVEKTILNIDYTKDNIKAEEALQDLMNMRMNNKTTSNNEHISRVALFTKAELYEGSKGLSTMIIYIGIYLGIIFLISSAAILALQQLSEAADNIDRYTILRKIGVERRMINRAILVQVFIYFMLPLSLAIVHSVIGIKVTSQIISMFGHMEILAPALFTGFIICIIYGGYFIATYIGCKNMIKK